MQDHSDTNLVMTDEELSNGYSPRSDQKTLSSQVSPKTENKFLNTQELLSPIPEQRETLPTYGDSERHLENSDDRNGVKVNESFATPRSSQYNQGKEYDESTDTNEMNNMHNLKKLINEARTAENEQDSYDNYKDIELPSKHGANTGKFASTHSERLTKAGDQKMEIDFGQNDSHDEYPNLREVQSAKNVSSTPGQIRLSKMSEEDAATVFESRKREILSTLLKKGANKKKAISQSLVGEKQRNSSQEKPGEFIIYNQKKLTSPVANGNSAPKKDDIVNKLMEKERDPSQSARKVLLEGSGNKSSKFMTPKITKTQLSRNNETPNDPSKEETNKIVVDLKKSNSKISQSSGRRTPVADKQYTKTTVSSKTKESNYISSPPYRGLSPAHTNPSTKRTPVATDPSVSSPKYEPQRDDNGVYKHKAREILNDINDLDSEIQSEILRLAQESNTEDDQEVQSYKDVYSKKRLTSQTIDSERRTPTSKSVYSNLNTLNAQRKVNDTHEMTPSVHSEDNRSNPKKRNNSDLPSDYVAPPNIKDQLNQSYSSLGTRKFSHHHEYLYERGMVQKIAQNDISMRTQRFKEQESLRDCTFSPDIGSSSQRKNEDIITKTRKWQAEKERNMVVQERAKVAREMAECTFSPNGASDKIGLKFPEKYYEKSMEWQKKVEENRQKKQDELYQSIMSVPDKSRNTSFNLSRMTDPNRTGLKSQGSNSIKQIPTKASTETISSPKSQSSPKAGYYVPRPGRGLDLKLKAKAANEEDRPSSQVQSQIAESYALLDGLQQFVNIKKELSDKLEGKTMKTQKTEASEKENSRAFIRGVANNSGSIYAQSQSNGSYRSLSKPKNPVKPEQNVEQRQTPPPQIITLEGYDKGYISQNVHKLVVKNNRYVVDDSISQHSLEDSQNISRNRREVSPNKPVSPRKPSNRYDQPVKPNLTTNGLTSPTTQTLENKYFDLLGKVNKVTKQLSQVKAENKTLQRDINSIQNNNIKNSLYS